MAGFSSIDFIAFVFSSFNALVRSRRSRRFNPKLLCVLGVQSLPAELHRLATNDAPDRIPAQKPV
jgi:hypothetical protein